MTLGSGPCGMLFCARLPCWGKSTPSRKRERGKRGLSNKLSLWADTRLRLLFFPPCPCYYYYYYFAFSNDGSSKKPKGPCTITVCVHFALKALGEEATLQMELPVGSFANQIFDNCWNLILLKFPEKCSELDKSRFILRLPHGMGRVCIFCPDSYKADNVSLSIALFDQDEMSFCTMGTGLSNTSMSTDSGQTWLPSTWSFSFSRLEYKTSMFGQPERSIRKYVRACHSRKTY